MCLPMLCCAVLLQPKVMPQLPSAQAEGQAERQCSLCGLPRFWELTAANLQPLLIPLIGHFVSLPLPHPYFLLAL